MTLLLLLRSPNRTVTAADTATAVDEATAQLQLPPLIRFSDNFDRPNNTDLGSDWVQNTTPGSGLGVVANQVQGAEAGGILAARWATPVGTSQPQFSQATVGTAFSIGPAVAMPPFSAGSNTGRAYALIPNGSDLVIIRVTFPTTVSFLDSTPYTPVVGDVLRLEYDGATLRGYVNGTLMVSSTVTSPLSLTQNNSVGLLRQNSTPNATVDSWSGGGTGPGEVVTATDSAAAPARSSSTADTATAVDSATASSVTNVTATDTATAVDSVTVNIVTNVTATDTATATDTIQDPSVDTAQWVSTSAWSSTEGWPGRVNALTVSIYASDASQIATDSAAVDIGTSTVQVSASDTAAANDDAAPAGNSAAADAASGVDVATTPNASLAGNATATGTDAASLAAAAPTADTAGSTTAATLAATNSAPDTASGVDTATVPSAALAPADAATAADTAVVVRMLAASDTAIGADTATPAPWISTNDPAAAADAGTVAATYTVSGADTASGTDAGAVSSATSATADVASSTTSALPAAALASAETATAADAAALSAALAATDTGTGVDTAALQAQAAASDTAGSIAAATPSATQAVSDSATANDQTGAVSYEALVLADSPAAYWRLDDLTDTSGHGHDLVTTAGSTTVGPSLLASDPANGSREFSISGVDGISTPDAADLRLTSASTVETWFRQTTPIDSVMWVLHKPGYYQLGATRNGKIRMTAYTIGGYFDLDSTTVFVENVTYHVAMTYDGTTFRMYVNGALEATSRPADYNSSTLPNSTASDFSIGQRSDGVLWGWVGEIDEVAVYQRVLSPEQIAGHYAAGSGGGASSVELAVQQSAQDAASAVEDTSLVEEADLPVEVSASDTARTSDSPDTAPEHSTYGDQDPPGTYNLYNDGNPSIVLGETFYRYGEMATEEGWVCTGARIWTEPQLYQPIRVMAWADPTGVRDGQFNLDTPPIRSVDTTVNTEGWTEVHWEPFELPALGLRWLIGYTFPDQPEQYVASIDTYDNVNAVNNGRVDSPEGLAFCKSDAREFDPRWGHVSRGYFRIALNDPRSAGGNVGYGVDTLVAQRIPGGEVGGASVLALLDAIEAAAGSDVSVVEKQQILYGQLWPRPRHPAPALVGQLWPRT